MVATLAIFARDDRTPYAADSKRRGYRKGAIVDIGDETHQWGRADGPPDFVRLTITDLSVAQVEQYLEPWHQVLDYRVDAHNVSLDRFDLTLFASRKRLSDGLGSMTRERVENYLADWNITVTAAASGEVSVRFRIAQIVTARHFWGRDVSAVVFAETLYVSGTGEHVGTADYSALAGADPAQIEARVAERAEVVAHDTTLRIITFRVFRADVLAFLRQAVRDDVDEWVAKRTWYFDPAAVDDALAAGGIIERTAAQVTPFLLSALDE